MSLRDIIFVVGFVPCLPFCFFRPFFGILMWTVVSLLNPHSFTWSMMSEFPWALAVAAPTLAGLVFYSPGWRGFFSREVGFIFVLWGWFTFTSLHNSDMPIFSHFAADTWFRWRVVSKIFCMSLATVLIVNTWERFRWFLLVMSGCFAVLVLKAVPFMILTGGSFRLYGPRGSALADNNDLGLALNMTLPIFFFLARAESGKRMRQFMSILVLATIPAIFFTYSRGALVGLAVVMLLMVMALRQRLVLIPILGVAATFALFLTPEKWQHRMDFTREGALLDDSALSRLNAWTYSWNLAKEFPLAGGGFEAFTQPLFDRYAPNPKDVHGPHSIYFGVLAEHGFVGIALYLGLLVSCFLTLGRIRRYARVWGDEQAGSYAPMLRFSLLAFMASGAFLGRAYSEYFFMIVACMIILSRLCAVEEANNMFYSEAVQEEQLA